MKTFIIALCIFVSAVWYLDQLAKEDAIEKVRQAEVQAKEKAMDEKIGKLLFPGQADPAEIQKDVEWCTSQGMASDVLGGHNDGAQHVICIP